MATVIRPEISEKNKYWIDKHRHYELKHFCLQYPIWKKEYVNCLGCGISNISLDREVLSGGTSDPTSIMATRRTYYSYRIKLLEDTAKDADEYLWHYILRAVTEGLSYTYLKSKLNIPCGRDMYYDRYRRFFWLLNEARN